MATKRDKERLARLDREIEWLKSNRFKDRVKIAQLDMKRAALRARIKKYTGDGVGGSARRRTRRGVGSSPTPPTTQGGS